MATVFAQLDGFFLDRTGTAGGTSPVPAGQAMVAIFLSGSTIEVKGFFPGDTISGLPPGCQAMFFVTPNDINDL